MSSKLLLGSLASSRLNKRRRDRKGSSNGLLDFQVELNPNYTRADHLGEMVERLETCINEPLRLILSAPPRHGKTQLILTLIVMYLKAHPDKLVAYCTYSSQLAESNSRQIRQMAKAAGLQFSDSSKAAHEWRLAQGGGLIAVGVSGPLTGYGISLLVVDDPHRSRAEAESPKIRQNVFEWWTSTAMSRLEPGASAIVTHCIAEDEPILMADGSWRSVQTVAPGMAVVGLEAGKFVSRQVTAAKQSGVDPIWTIKTPRKVLRTNDRHPVLTESGEWAKVKDLKIGDRIRVVDVGVGAETVDPEFAWFFGFMIGDGWVTDWERNNKLPSGGVSRSRSWCVCVARCIYEDRNERACAMLEQLSGRKPKLTKFGYYRVDCNALGRKLQSLGIGKGAWNKRIPEWVFKLTPELKREFLRGYAAADGAYAPRTTDSFIVASCNKALIDDTRLLAISAGIRVTKISQSSQMVKAPHSKEPKLSTMFKVTLNFSGAIDQHEEVISISVGAPAPVYDLTVEGAENFVTSGICTHNTRWHQDDLTGTLLKESAADWQYVNLKAISDDGKPLWPLRYDLAALEKRRKDVGEYEWAALYMGDPRPKGGAVFKNTNVYLQADDIRWLIEHSASDRCKCASCCGYRKLPIAFKRIAIGLDLAYTEDTYADYSVAIVLGLGIDNRFYVLDCVRAQCELPTFIQKLKVLRQTYTDAKMFWYTGGQEKEIARQIKASGLPIQTEKALADKFVRAQDVAAAWNDNMILVPEGGEKYPWVNKFLSEVLSFTGIGDTHDDDVDALAAAYMRLKVHTGGVRRNGTNRVLPF